MAAIYPSWIEPTDYHIAFFAQIRRDPAAWAAFGRQNSVWVSDNYFNDIKNILAYRDNRLMHSFRVRVIALNGDKRIIDAIDFTVPAYEKFCVIRTLPLPVADEIWTHFDPVFVKNIHIRID